MLTIIGVGVSLLVAWLKKVYATNEYKTLFVLLLVSLAAATFYVLIKDTSYWKAIFAILEAAGAFYAFILQRFNQK